MSDDSQHPEPPSHWQAPASPPPIAMRPKRTGLFVGLIGGGILLLALIIGGGAWFAVQTAAHTPQAAARPFLTALASGDVAAIKRLGHISTTSPLVSQRVYSKTQGHITAYRVRPGTSDSQSATVLVTYTQNGDRHTETLSLEKTGTDLLFFPTWKLEPVKLPTIGVQLEAPADSSAVVNGVPVQRDGASTALVDVLPGDYDIELADSRYYQADGQSLWITALQASGSKPTTSVTLQARLTESGRTAATAAVNTWVTDCIAQQTITPSGCSFGLLDDYPDVRLTNQRWTLVKAPQFDIGLANGGDWEDGGWIVTTVTPGSATFRADASLSDGRSGTLTSLAPVKVSVEGAVTGFDAHGHATFRSIDWSGKEATANA